MSYNPSTNLLTVVASNANLAANGGGYALQANFATAAFNPVASTVYYGGGGTVAAATTSPDVRRLFIPKSGTIKAAYGFFVQTASASGTVYTLAIRNNGTTDTTIATAPHNLPTTTYSNTGLSIAVTQGQYIEVNWLTNATGALPTNVIANFSLYIE